jgi:hypothetical protein
MGKDIVDEVGNSCGFGEIGDGDAGLGVPSTVERSGSRSVLYEGAGGGVTGVTLEEILCSEEETSRGLCAQCLERRTVGLYQ